MLGNENNYSKEYKSKTNYIYLGSMITIGLITLLYSVFANRYRNDKILFITIIGAFIGLDIGLIINGIISKLFHKEK